ncbi:MAG TPA: hypothetical protein IGS53_10155 [Leptolyngbyaceae cyanobacterium M33_DOE_097]|nr:hypothetical protein [Leptolyngbyaceae cyanobacterium M33_DOE_097]
MSSPKERELNNTVTYLLSGFGMPNPDTAIAFDLVRNLKPPGHLTGCNSKPWSR